MKVILQQIFDWYQCAWYVDPAAQFPEDSRTPGRWVRVAHDVESPMTFWVPPQSCKTLASRSSVVPLTEDELSDPELELSIKSR